MRKVIVYPGDEGYWMNIPACLAASDKVKRKKMQVPISMKQARDTLQRGRKTIWYYR